MHNKSYSTVMIVFDFLFWQPYDFLSLIPVIKGAGGVITDWKGNELHWEASPDSCATSMLIICCNFVSFWFTWSNQIDELDHQIPCCFYFPGFNVVAAGDKLIHQQAVDSLEWQ